MDRRTAVVLIVVTALLALPVLCLGGFLEHACGCHEAPDGHDACADDPCDGVVRGHEPDWVLDDLASARLAPTPRAAPERARSGPRRRRAEGQPAPASLPYHTSDVPLRI